MAELSTTRLRISERNSTSRNDESIHRQSAHTNHVSHRPVINSQIHTIPVSSPPEPQSAEANTINTSSDAQLTQRKLSFSSWSDRSFLKVDDLAKAGFVYIGYGDGCQCSFCGLRVMGWVPGDDPYVEHAKLSEKCPHIRHCMGQEFIDVVQDLQCNAGANKITRETVVEQMRIKGHTIRSMFDESQVENDPAVRALVDYGYSLETVSKAALELRRNRVILSALEILEKLNEKEPAEGGAGADERVGGIAARNDSEYGSVQALERENELLRRIFLCKFCSFRTVRVVFMPCGHLIYCRECSYALITCPNCGADIKDFVTANI